MTVIPTKGLYSFGGNELTKSQNLKSLEGEWELGHDLFENRPTRGQCDVQVNNFKIAFFKAQKYFFKEVLVVYKIKKK